MIKGRGQQAINGMPMIFGDRPKPTTDPVSVEAVTGKLRPATTPRGAVEPFSRELTLQSALHRHGAGGGDPGSRSLISGGSTSSSDQLVFVASDRHRQELRLRISGPGPQ